MNTLIAVAIVGVLIKNIMNRDLQRLDNRIRQLERNNAKLRNNIKMYEIKVGKLRHELGKNIDNNDRL